MSLETVIAENTAAIRELIAALANGVPTTNQQVQAVVEEAKAEKPAKAKKAEAPKQEAEPEPAATPEPKAEPAAAAAEAEPKAQAEASTYQDAASAITKLSRAKGRDAAVALLAQFGASKLPEVKPEQFADIIAAAEEAMQ